MNNLIGSIHDLFYKWFKDLSYDYKVKELERTKGDLEACLKHVKSVSYYNFFKSHIDEIPNLIDCKSKNLKSFFNVVKRYDERFISLEKRRVDKRALLKCSLSSGQISYKKLRMYSCLVELFLANEDKARKLHDINIDFLTNKCSEILLESRYGTICDFAFKHCISNPKLNYKRRLAVTSKHSFKVSLGKKIENNIYDFEDDLNGNKKRHVLQNRKKDIF